MIDSEYNSLRRFEIVRFLVENALNVKEQNESGWTPIMNAVWHNNIDLVKLLNVLFFLSLFA